MSMVQRCSRYASLTEKHFQASALSTLPESLQSLMDDLSDQGIPPMGKLFSFFECLSNELRPTISLSDTTTVQKTCVRPRFEGLR
jgi:hypothetical protein